VQQNRETLDRAFHLAPRLKILIVKRTLLCALLLVLPACARSSTEGASDPAVAEGVMTAELHPYRVALMRGERID